MEQSTEFKTEHALDFEIGHREDFYSSLGCLHFKVGTVKGVYGTDLTSYFILAVINDSPSNGHLKDVFQWFEHSCRREKKHLRIIEIMNRGFKKALINKYGFKHLTVDSVIKKF